MEATKLIPVDKREDGLRGIPRVAIREKVITKWRVTCYWHPETRRPIAPARPAEVCGYGVTVMLYVMSSMNWWPALSIGNWPPKRST